LTRSINLHGLPPLLDRFGGRFAKPVVKEPIMADTALVPVDFHGTPLYTAVINGVPHVAIKPICDALSVNWSGQFLRIQRHPVLSSTICITQMVAEDGKTRDVVCLPLDKLNGWLFGISAARVRDPACRERLIEYQRECFDVLARHFGAAPAQPSAEDYPRITPEQKRQLVQAMPLQYWWLSRDTVGHIYNHIRVAFHVVSIDDFARRLL
jgi:hypothetical protein